MAVREALSTVDALGVPLLLLVVPAVVFAAVGAANLLPRPALALTLFVVVTTTGVSNAVGYVGPISVYLVALGIATLALLLGLRTGQLRLPRSPVFAAAALFLGTRLMSMAVADDAAVAQSTVIAEGKDVVVLVVVAVLFVALPRPRVVLAAAVFGMTLLAALSLGQEFVLHNSTTFAGLSNVPLPSELPGLSARHSGTEADVNFWARTLVLFSPFGLSLAMGCHALRRWMWFLATAVLAGGVYLTQSRGGLLALAAAIVTWSVLYVRSLVRVGVVVAALSAVAIAVVPGVGARLSTLTSVNSGNVATTDQSLVDRAAVQRVGWAMAAHAPFLGVGPGNFTVAEPDYRRRIAPELSQITAPHNIYLEMLAEGGVIGLTGWLALYGAALFAATRALVLLRRLDARGPPSNATLLSIATLSALLAWALASLVLHLADFPILLIIMGLAAALDARARDLAEARLSLPRYQRPPATPTRHVPVRRIIAAGTAVAVAALVAVVPQLLRGSKPISTVQALVVPTDPQADPYVYDVLSRTTIVTTYAALLREPSFAAAAARRAGLSGIRSARIQVEQSGTSAAVTVNISHMNVKAGSLLGPALIAAVAAAVAPRHPLYVLRLSASS